MELIFFIEEIQTIISGVNNIQFSAKLNFPNLYLPPATPADEPITDHYKIVSIY